MMRSETPSPSAQKRAYLSGAVEPVPVPTGYKLSMAAVAVAMVLLPGVYLGIVAAAAAGTVLYPVYAWPAIAQMHSWQLSLIAGGGPPIAGIVLVVYMVRSMIPRKRPGHGGIGLAYAAAPALHDLVREIADAIGAPRPREIRVDLDANASAALRHGAFSLFRRDLLLTVGLPLAAGLDRRQLAGIVAHELGHFAQRGGMGLSYLIRSIQNWFARVVYGRNDLDGSLERQAESGFWAKRLIAQMARFFLWVSRKILWLLMQAGGALSAALSRQMEFDADRYSARVVGARVALATLEELPRLEAATSAAWSEANWHWREGRLTGDLPGRVADFRRELAGETLREIDVAYQGATRTRFATHPSFLERRQSLQSEPEEGVYRDESPARELFADFESTCRAASIAGYKEDLGAKFDEARLLDRSEIEETRARNAAASEVYVRLFGAILSRSRALPLGIVESAVLSEADRAAALSSLSSLAAEARAEREAIEPVNRRFADLEQLGDLLEELAALRAAGVPQAQWGPPDEIAKRIAEVLDEDTRPNARTRAHSGGDTEEGGSGSPAGGAADTLSAAISSAASEQAFLLHELQASDARTGRRLTLALAASADAAVKREALALVKALGILDRSLPDLREVRRGAGVVHALWSRVEAHRKRTSFGAELERRYAALHAALERLTGVLVEQQNPLQEQGKASTLQKAIVPELPPAEAAWEALQAADAAVARWVDVRVRMMTRLAALAAPTHDAAEVAGGESGQGVPEGGTGGEVALG